VFLASTAMLWSQQWRDYMAEMVAVWIMAGVVLLFWILVTGLISFHIFLNCLGTTTYEYLMTKKKAKVAPQPQH
jgi:hypothetical protein